MFTDKRVREALALVAADPPDPWLATISSRHPASTRPWNAAAMRDVTEIGHYGMGDTEYSLTTTDQLGELERLIRAAYDALGNRPASTTS